jgi:FtsP/CotA-like multicopper oxidase with cupredoxin domain
MQDGRQSERAIARRTHLHCWPFLLCLLLALGTAIHSSHRGKAPAPIGETVSIAAVGAVRDTIWIPPAREVTIAFDAVNPGQWAFHCHHLYHMATGMMTTLAYEA